MRAVLPTRNKQDLEGENWARRRGLLFGGQYYVAEVPVEVALAVRAGDLTVSFHPDTPALVTTPVAGVRRSLSAPCAGSRAAAADFTETVAGLLDSLSRSPLPALKAGGVGSREVARAREVAGRPRSLVRFALELIRALGLLAGAGGGVGVGRGGGGDWRADEPGARFADLAVAWWGLPVTPSLTHDDDGKVIPAIGGRSADGAAMLLRWAVLDAIGGAAAGHRSGVAGLVGRAPQLAAAGDDRAAGPGGRRDLGRGARARGAARRALTPIGRGAAASATPSALLASPDRCWRRRPASAGSVRT